ncbi:uncharacterized protein [Onthophagus taurus]|uniref:uncharacterized protein n=1 Tax=Onthophagus taurus TaxID=166361 RepID=UPI0039BE8A9C
MKLESQIAKLMNAELSVWIQTMRGYMMKRENTRDTINFLHQAVAQGVTPKVFTIKTPKIFKHQKQDLERKLIKKNLRTQYKKLSEIDTILKFIHRKLSTTLHFLEFEELTCKLQEETTYKTIHSKNRKQQKLARLVKNKHYHLSQQEKNKNHNNNSLRNKDTTEHNTTTTTHNSLDRADATNGTFMIRKINKNKPFEKISLDTLNNVNFAPRYTNLSNFTFTNKDIELLNLSHKFSLPAGASPVELAIKIESQLSNNTNIRSIFHDNHNIIKNLKTDHCSSYAFRSIQHNLKSFRQKIKENKLIITMGDKGAGYVILNDFNYIEKTENFFRDNNIIKIKKNPTINYNNTLKRHIKDNRENLKIFDINPFKTIIMNPLVPTLKSLIKLHKVEQSIRPIISNVNTPSSIIAKKLQTFLHKTFSNQFQYNIKNSTQLIDKLKNIHITKEHRLISFDIKNLYSNIPIKPTIDIIKQFLIKKLNTLNISFIELNTFIDTLKLVTDQNFFTFNKQFYRMNTGLPMGSPISGIMADIFVNQLEKEIFSDKYNIFTSDITFYGRYVDDILIIYKGNNAKLLALFNLFNNASNLQFTLEIEKHHSLNFLDLEITKNLNKNKLDFNIYCKPTTTDSIIPKKSFTCLQHKEAAFRYYFNRLFNVPLDDNNYKKELMRIIKIGLNNGYNLNDIQNFYNKAHKSLINKIIYPHHKLHKHYITIPFEPLLQFKFKNNLEQYNITPAFTSGIKLGQLINNTKHKFEIDESSGVYRINCGDCDRYYIGQTGRNLKTRFREHLTKDSSAFYKHLKSTKHKTDSCNIKLLKNIKKSKELDLLEEFYIHTNKSDLLLNDLTDFNNNRFFLNFI